MAVVYVDKIFRNFAALPTILFVAACVEREMAHDVCSS